jgi:hypothetical protein
MPDATPTLPNAQRPTAQTGPTYPKRQLLCSLRRRRGAALTITFSPNCLGSVWAYEDICAPRVPAVARQLRLHPRAPTPWRDERQPVVRGNLDSLRIRLSLLSSVVPCSLPRPAPSPA